jgi:hypothetical protein
VSWRTLRTGAITVLGLALVIVLAAGGGQPKPARAVSHSPAPAGRGARAAASKRAAAGLEPARLAARHRRDAACPGHRVADRPQTLGLPSTLTAAFRCEVQALWTGIQTGRLAPAMPAFFPEQAYVQVKAIPDPQADWRERLVGHYALDLRAAHALLGKGAASARLIRVIVPAGFAHLVAVNVCSNRFEYWETANSRLVYEERGSVHSLGIASMISWRGYWFVVHLGAVLESGPAGVVDAPSSGVGVAVPSGTC